MKTELLFYDKDEFYDYKALKFSEGYSIESISKYIKNPSLIENFDYNSEIVDISGLVEYDSKQVVGENAIFEFEEEAIFIADKKHKSKFLYDLRFIFIEFKDVEKSYLKGEVKFDDEDETKITSKTHKKIIDLEEDQLNLFLEKFNDKLYGHPKFKNDFEDQIRTFRIFNKLKEHKILSLFLLGDSGVGKTEVARTIFNCLEGKKHLAKINFGNYSNEFSLSSLIGASRGYVGSDDGEIFMKVRDTDVGILLIDEFEKSNATLFNFFLDVLENGKMTNSLGEELDLNGFIIVFTSNISKEDFPKRISPELRSRFDYKCRFTLLSDDDKNKYIEFRVKNLIQKVKLEFNTDLADNTIEHFKKYIDVKKYKNMRDINKQIKKVFLVYIRSLSQTDNNEESIETVSSFSKMRKIINIFNS